MYVDDDGGDDDDRRQFIITVIVTMALPEGKANSEYAHHICNVTETQPYCAQTDLVVHCRTEQLSAAKLDLFHHPGS